jgi:hypothetical protein
MKAFPKFRDGDPLEPWHLNLIFRELERWRKLTGQGPLVVRHGDSPTIELLQADDIVLVRTNHGPIPKRNATTGVWGSVTVTLYDESQNDDGDPRTVLGEDEEVAFNKGPNDVPADKDVFCKRGLDGRLYALVAWC